MPNSVDEIPVLTVLNDTTQIHWGSNGQAQNNENNPDRAWGVECNYNGLLHNNFNVQRQLTIMPIMTYHSPNTRVYMVVGSLFEYMTIHDELHFLYFYLFFCASLKS